MSGPELDWGGLGWKAMTMIVAWRDPFCVVPDDLETDN